MENLPVELISIILTHLETARDVVVASSTCKNWREAFKKHIHIATMQLEVMAQIICLSIQLEVPKFYQMLSKASKLRRLGLWGVVFADEDQVIDPECITGSFPELKHLALSYKIVDGRNLIEMQDFLTLENVDVLKLGCTVISKNFGHWVFGMIERCPKLKK